MTCCQSIGENRTPFTCCGPIRPYEIQIGEYRAKRYGRDFHDWEKYTKVPFDQLLSPSELRTLYPVLLHSQYRWLRMLLAELLSDPDALAYMASVEADPEIQMVIARNPAAPNRIKEQNCPFCDRRFRELRERPQGISGAVLIATDFPFGPFFDYIVFPAEPIHTWDAIVEQHLLDMNWVVHQYLCSKYDGDSKTVRGAAGIRFGSSCSTRHLVIGPRTRSSADASIAHVNKRVWGMEEGAANLADHLRNICLECESRGQDYLGSYLEALRRAGMVIWEDEHVALFVPFGQIALHELQIMVKRPTRHFLELTVQEVRSLSRAEYIVARLYGRMDINSFNEAMLSLPFADTRSTSFRLIFKFISRTVDLGLSELSPVYVVDRHPWDTVLEIDRLWPTR